MKTANSSQGANASLGDSRRDLFGWPAFNQAVGYQPVITVLPSGTQMSVSGVVSADRRYVRITPVADLQRHLQRDHVQPGARHHGTTTPPQGGTAPGANPPGGGTDAGRAVSSQRPQSEHSVKLSDRWIAKLIACRSRLLSTRLPHQAGKDVQIERLEQPAL